MDKRILSRFIVGGSIISSAISFGYIGNAMKNWRASKKWTPKQFNYFIWMMAFVLFLLGVFNSGLLLIEEEFNEIHPRYIMMTGGLVFGIVLSTLGRQFHFPTKVFNFKNPNLVHFYAALLYSFVFGFIIYPLNVFIGI